MLAVTSTGLRHAQAVGLGDVVHHPFDRVPTFLERGGAKQQHELVAAQARHHVVPAGPVAQRAPQAVRQLDQQAIAGLDGRSGR